VAALHLTSQHRDSRVQAFASGVSGGVGARTSDRKALVVEDDAAMATTIADALAVAGWTVVSSPTIADARRMLATERPSLLVLDLTLSDEFGGELLEQLAGRDDAPATVIVSGFGLAPIIAARFEVELVKKPFDVERFLVVVERAERTGVRPRANA